MCAFVSIVRKADISVHIGSKNKPPDIRALSLHHEVAPCVFIIGIVTLVASFVNHYVGPWSPRENGFSSAGRGAPDKWVVVALTTLPSSKQGYNDAFAGTLQASRSCDCVHLDKVVL